MSIQTQKRLFFFSIFRKAFERWKEGGEGPKKSMWLMLVSCLNKVLAELQIPDTDRNTSLYGVTPKKQHTQKKTPQHKTTTKKAHHIVNF